MDWESLGGGGVTGFLASLMAIFNWNKRIDEKQDKAACTNMHLSVSNTTARLQMDMDYVKARVDKIYDMMINGTIGGKHHE